jgi:hypothetical protein
MKPRALAAKKIVNIDGTKQVELDGSSQIAATSFPAATVYVDGVPGTAISDTKWHLVTVTDSTGVSPTTFELGRVSASYYDGVLDDVRVYNRELAATEIAKMYTQGALRLNVGSVALQNGTTLGVGLQGLWTFDGDDTNWTSASAGVAYDRSGNKNHGTFTNMTRKFSQTIGKLGQGISFDGVDDIIDISPATGLNITGSLTISAWTYVRSLSSGNFNYVAAKRDLASGPDTYSFEMNDTNLSCAADPGNFRPWLWWTTAGNVFVGFASNTTITTGVWQHWVIVRNASNSTVKFYLNGADAGSTNACTTVFGTAETTTSNPTIGWTSDGDAAVFPFNGRVDDVRIYNRALSATEIKQLYQLGAATIKPN